MLIQPYLYSRSLFQCLYRGHRYVAEWTAPSSYLVTSLPIEDAPAPMALHSFETQIRNGKILVTANTASTLKSNLSRQPKLLATGVNSTGKGVLIIGGGSGAFNTVESLREVS